MSENDRGEAARAAFLKGIADRKADNAAAAREEAERADPKKHIYEHYFYHKPRLYYYKSGTRFIPQDKDSVRRRLQDIVPDADIAGIMLEIESRNYVPTVYPMQPGRRAGLMESKGCRYIVLNDYYFPHPTGQQGACDTILQVLNALFGAEQIAYFLSWVKGARHRIKQCLTTGDFSTACQALCIVGAHDIGKTGILCKHILEPLLGGAMVDYGEMLKQGKQFNGELLSGCFLVSDDKGTLQGTNARKRMADTMKSIGYAGSYSIEAKGKTAISVRVPWVQVVLANDDDAGLNSIPDFSGMEDKFIALYAEKRDSFPPNNTEEEREALDKALADELPAFAWYVDNYTPPDDMKGETGRHVCREYVAPVLAKLLQPLTEDARLMNAIELLISDRITCDIDVVCHADGISAVQLQCLLRKRNLWREEAGRTMGRKLTRLCEKYPEQIRWKYVHDNKKVYIVSRPADTAGEDE